MISTFSGLSVWLKLRDFGQGFFEGRPAKLIEFPVLQPLRQWWWRNDVAQGTLYKWALVLCKTLGKPAPVFSLRSLSE